MSVRITERQYDTLLCLAKGYTNLAIAKELGIKKRTVETHVSELLSKFNVHSRLQLISNLDKLVFHVENLKGYARKSGD
jgi:DNA-binding NarL/FixJ family response regulator